MRKLNGHRPTHRNKWLFIKAGILNIQELSLLEFYADLLDFDKEHDSFGRFEIDFLEIASFFNCRSVNTIRNWHSKLLKLGFIRGTNKRNVFELSCFTRYITPGFWGGKAGDFAKIEKDQPVGIILQNFGVEIQKNEQQAQHIGESEGNSASNQDTKALGSSKDESKVHFNKKVVIKQQPRSEEEYQKIYQEGNYSNFSTEDMKWVDENLQEVLEVTEENEEEIVKIYFGGDLENYKRHVIGSEVEDRG